MTDTNASELGQSIKAECSECGGMRNCDVLGFHNDRRGLNDYISWYKKWYILACRGCEHVFVQTAYGDEDQRAYGHNEDGEPVEEHYETNAYWPALAKRKPPEWLNGLGYSIDDLWTEVAVPKVDSARLAKALRELYTALDNDLFMLAGIGVRTCFDIASELLGIAENQTFKDKLNQLVKDGHIGQVDMDHLEFLVEAGNASAHRGWVADRSQISTMMDVLESFIHRAFIEPARKEKLSAAVAESNAVVPKRAASKPKAELPAPATPENTT
ncbi:DUF4145 domain-containing protein [Asticcacaulis taihuensis]|uniref:DUF4145 domain-containing protein n=1 Tax=Asticcacaulis taihuensis TaxID=260084 RepID=A0A1G4PUW8_9CAUL|nr:DUF4145 domain-containing protein [Asticcacaulis taihuensis]SCW36113.1 protein of unknown function [Asticcacaulis taihuensis]